MDIDQLRDIVEEFNNDNPPDDVPVDEVVHGLSASNRAMARASAEVIAGVAGNRTASLGEHVDAIVEAAADEDPLVRGPAMRAIAAISERNPDIVAIHDDVIASGLSAADPQIRGNASLAVAELAETDPAAVAAPEAAWSGMLRELADDQVKTVKTSILRAIADTAETHPGWASRAVDGAVEAAQAADPDVRFGALHLLTVLSAEAPAVVDPHLETIAGLLSDPSGLPRGLAAAIVGNLGYERDTDIEPYADQLTTMLADPEPTAQRNASHALLALGTETPSSVVEAGVGAYLVQLLARDVVAVQENGIHLTAIVASHDPSSVGNVGTVREMVTDLRSDPVIDVEPRVFDRIEQALAGQPESRQTGPGGKSGGGHSAGTRTRTGTASGSPSGSPEGSDTGTDVDPATTPERGDDGSSPGSSSSGTTGTSSTTDGDTEVFNIGGDSTGASGPSGRTDSGGPEPDGREISYCPGCSANLGDYESPTFCPECGLSLDK